MPCMMSFSMPFRTASMDPTPPDHIQSRPVATPMAVLRSPTPPSPVPPGTRATLAARGSTCHTARRPTRRQSSSRRAIRRLSRISAHRHTPRHPYTTPTPLTPVSALNSAAPPLAGMPSPCHLPISPVAPLLHPRTTRTTRIPPVPPAPPVSPVPPVYHPYPRPVVPLLRQPALP